MHPKPVTLVGNCVDMVPLEVRHGAELHAASDEELFRFLLQRPREWSIEGFEDLIDRMLRQPRVAFAIIEKKTGRAIGCTSYLNIRSEHMGLEIGTTWIGRRWHGTAVNPESKLLLIEHAVEKLGAARVDFLVSIHNQQSQAAVAKLGATREGVLRNRWRLPDGTVCDAVSYSVTREDWPVIKPGLLERVALRTCDGESGIESSRDQSESA